MSTHFAAGSALRDPDEAAWRAERRAYVTSPTGNLALVAYQPVTGDEPVPVEEGFPATVALVPGREGVAVTAGPDAGVTVDGTPVAGTTFVARLRSDGTPIVRWGDLSFDVFSLDGSDYELRIYDAGAQTLADFAEIEYYPPDPALVLPATYERYAETGDVPWDFTRSTDSGHLKKVPGVVRVSVAGVDYELLAFADSGLLVIVFADGTTGSESYAPGRFLKLPLPPEGGHLTLDFNRAFIPPCGFSYFYSCPVPPPQNRIAAPIRGGEKRVRFHSEGGH